MKSNSAQSLKTFSTLGAFVLLALSASASIAAPAKTPSNAEMAALAKSKNCMACHAVDKKLVGPAFKDVALKYGKKPAESVDGLATKVMKGTSGVWGPIPMPANTQVSATEARQLVEWILREAPAK